MYRRTGKQVLYNDQHFADAVTECAAQLIVDGLNNPERDYDWDVGSGVVQTINAVNGIETHNITRQNDEYACSCGARWDASEGEEHP